MAFFEEVARQRDDPDGVSPPISSLLYTDMPENFWWNLKCWKRRANSNIVKVPRLLWVHPNYRECFHLRMMLQHVRGPASYADCRTVNGASLSCIAGRIYDTFEEAARAAGLCEDALEASRCMEEAASFKMPRALRELFAILVTRCSADAAALYNRHEKVPYPMITVQDMAADFIHAAVVAGGPDGVTAAVRQQLLRELEGAVRNYGRKLTDFRGIPELFAVDDVDDTLEQFVIDGDELAERVLP